MEELNKDNQNNLNNKNCKEVDIIDTFDLIQIEKALTEIEDDELTSSNWKGKEISYKRELLREMKLDKAHPQFKSLIPSLL